MHGRWSVLVRLRVNHWSWVMLVVVFAASARAMPSRTPSPNVLSRFGDEDDEVREELEAIKGRILADLGLSAVPDVSKANVSVSQMDTMLELYRRSVMESEREEEEEEETVLRFYSYTDTASTAHTIFHLGNNSSTKRVLFPLHTNPSLQRKGHYLQSAKLHLPVEEGWPIPQILIYRLLEEPSSPNSSRALVMNLVVDTTTPHHAQVDVSDIVRQWLDNPKLNFGLLLECQGCWNASAARPESPVLDVLISEFPARVKRSSSVRPDNSGMAPLDCTKGLRTKKCCRRSLTVSFQDIGWNWIVQPVEFEAFFCKGRCRYRSNNFSSTHALVQSILNRKGYKVPRPCCAPNKLRALNLLHYNDKNPPELVVTRQKGMIVKECACS